jgi:hypothetical protein
MAPRMAPREGGSVAPGRLAAAPARLTTTLYDLLAVLQAVVGADDDTLVVATVVHLLANAAFSPERRHVTGAAPTAGAQPPDDDNLPTGGQIHATDTGGDHTPSHHGSRARAPTAPRWCSGR